MSFFRPELDRMAGYMPGEQPQDGGWVKLNTNENPYPPSPRVVEALTAAAQGKLNLYPDPHGTAFRKAASAALHLDPDWILPGNGSDEILTILTRSFTGPSDQIAYPYPSYILYETLADLQGVRHERLLLEPDWSWNFDRIGKTIEQSKLIFVPNPNSPSGNRWPFDDLLALVPKRGMLVLDEAYGDFADHPHQCELLNSTAGRQIVVTRTFSKSYSLAGVRFGFAVAHPDTIAGLRKMKDSYNCDSLSLAARLDAPEHGAHPSDSRTTDNRTEVTRLRCRSQPDELRLGHASDRPAQGAIRGPQVEEDSRPLHVIRKHHVGQRPTPRRPPHHHRHRRRNRLTPDRPARDCLKSLNHETHERHEKKSERFQLAHSLLTLPTEVVSRAA